jgi:hypothetical protein
MNDDLLIARLRDLPPDLGTPGDRMASVRRRVTRRRRARTGVAALAVALLAGGLAAGFADLRDRAVTPDRPAPACPADPGGPGGNRVTVPAAPGVDTGGHLVPRQAPTRAVVCRYALRSYDPTKGQASWALRAGALAGGLDRLGEDLWWFPRAPTGWMPVCTTRWNPHPVDYLVGLQYPGGTVWISTAGSSECTTTTNGDFVSDRLAGDQVERSLAAGAWVPSARLPRADETNPCETGPEPGRYGQDTTLVPPAPVELRICRQSDDQSSQGLPIYGSATLRTGVAELAAQLSSGRTQSSNPGCDASGGITDSYLLLFRYAEGPPVRVGAVIGCDPPLVGDTVVAWEAPGTDLATRLAAIYATNQDRP